MKRKTKKQKTASSRRKFIKIGGAVDAGLQVGTVAGAGIAAGKDPSTHTGLFRILVAGREKQNP